VKTAMPAARYMKFVGWTLLVVALLFAIGLVPTRRLSGEAGLPAMAAGILAGWLSAVAAGWPLVAGTGPTPMARLHTALLAMGVRVAVVIALGVAAALAGGFATAPLLFWLAVSYVALLPLEVKLAIET
jgi:hypothetical protein